MNANIEKQVEPLKLRALDPDLPMLAARAAMELDSYRSFGEVGFIAVKELSLRLKNSFPSSYNSTAPCKALLDSSTVSLVGRALNSSWSVTVSTVDQLNAELWAVAERLDRVEAAPADQPIEKMRNFCVALSEGAASCRQAVYDLRPAHPFRR